ncbi:MAG TPA: histidine kinase [Spirochaetia bacterium]|nr:histidine kinase [Spirochaetia bacterium]
MEATARRPAPQIGANHVWIVLIVSVVLQAGAGAEYVFGFSGNPAVVERVRNLLTVVLPISFAISILLCFSRSVRVRISLLGSRFLLMFVAGYAVGPDVVVPSLFVISVIAELVAYLTFWRALVGSALAIAATVLSHGTVSAWDVVVSGGTPWQLGTLLVSTSGFAAFGLMFRKYYEISSHHAESIRQLDRTVDALSRANRGFQQYAVDAELRAAEAERNRIVRELHDSIGYTLTNILVMTRVASRTPPEEAANLAELLEAISGQAQSGLTEMRSTLRILRAGESNRPRGMEAIRQLAATFQRSTGIAIRIESTNARWIADSPLDASIFRIVQEALTNSFRHGHANHVLIHFWQDQSGIFLDIEDDGAVTSQSSIGLGLSGMEERVREQCGTFSALGTRHGFLIRTWFPATAIGAGA